MPNSKHPNFHGDLLHPLGALRPDLTIDEAVLEQQARIKARTLCDDPARMKRFAALGLEVTFESERIDAEKEYRRACESRISYLNFLDAREAEEAKGPLHARVVELETHLAVLENCDSKSDGHWDAIQSTREKLADAIRERDAAERQNEEAA